MNMYKVTARVDDIVVFAIVNESNIYNAVVEGSRKLKCTYADIVRVEII